MSKVKYSFIGLLTFVFIFFACTKDGESKLNFNYHNPKEDKVAATFGDVKITEQEMISGMESEIYEAEKKVFDLKMGKVRSLILEKIISTHPDKKNLSNDEFLEKFIAKGINVKPEEIEKFIKEKDIPQEHLNDQMRARIKSFLEVEMKKEAVEKWMGKQIKNGQVDIFLQRPQRPVFNVTAGDAPFAGGKDAKVTVVEFSDFQCPYCAKGAEVVGELKKKYGNKIKIAFKQFPLPFHTQAKPASIATLCANEQNVDSFWKMHDRLFADQTKLGIDDLKKVAADLKLDVAKFNNCLDSNKYAAKVEADMEEGKKIGVKSTPTFFVNGMLVSGAQPIEVFAEIIDEELKKN